MTKKVPKRANGGNASAKARKKDPEKMRAWKEAIRAGNKLWYEKAREALSNLEKDKEI